MFQYKDYVYEVYKEKSFSKAAENLYISQPSLSARIIKMEQAFGMPLFDRSTSPLRLTEFGEAYIKATEDVRKIEKRIENFIADISQLRLGELSIGASSVFAAYALPPLIADFKKQYPQVKIKLTEEASETLESLLSENKVDMVIDNNRYDMGVYDRAFYTEERILLAVPKSFKEWETVKEFALDEECIRTKAYKRKDFPAVPLSVFSSLPFVMLTPGNDTRIRGDRMCKEAGFHPHIALEVHQQTTAYMIAATNAGATFIADVIAEKLPAHPSMAYFKLDSTSAERTVFFHFKKHKRKTRVMQEFMNFIARKG